MANSGNMSVCAVIIAILVAVGVSDPTPVSSIQSPDGDVIDCIRTLDQLTFRDGDPLLKNHQLQEFPSNMPKPEGKRETIRQIWHNSGMECPTGTVPIRRASTSIKVPHRKTHPLVHHIENSATLNHKYAYAFKDDNRTKFFGTRATLNVWDPLVESRNDFSLAQIWLASGSYETRDVNTIEAGWQVCFERYLDYQPRLFTFWTDQISGNWWLGLGRDIVEPVGYWPAAIFTLLSDHAIMAHWGGEVLYRNTSGLSPVLQMGSGNFADKGFKNAAYFCNLKLAIDNLTFLPVQNIGIFADFPEYYTIKKWRNKECGEHFFYGGHGPMLSNAVCRCFNYLWLLLYFVIVLCL